MKMLKRSLIEQKTMRATLTLALMLLTSISAWAQDTFSGTCGDYGNENNVTWVVTDTDGNGSYETLTISGTGATKNYGSGNPAPWAAFKSDITTVVIGDGVTRIGGNAFYQFTALTSVTIASSVTTIGNAVFFGCTNLTTVSGASGVTYVDSSAFDETAWENNLPDGLTSVGHVAYRFVGDGTSVNLDAATTQIYEYCFRDSKITSIVIPASVERIGDYAFANSALQKMYVLRSGSNSTEITQLGNDAFSECRDDLVIVVLTAAYSTYSGHWYSYNLKLQRGYNITCNEGITATSFAPIVAEGETVTLGYTGEVPTGCDVRYSIDGGTTLLVGNTFQMPAADVTVTAVLNGPDQPFVVTTYADLKAKMATGGYIRVGADVSPSSAQESYLTVPKDVSVTLDLNGHTIDQKYNNDYPSYRLWVAGTLTLNDSGTGGTIKGGRLSVDSADKYGFGGCVFVAPTGEFTMNGGTITGGTANNGGGGVYIANSDKPLSTYGPSWDGYQNASYDMKLGTTASIDLKRHISGFPSPVVSINSTFDSNSGGSIDPSTYSISDDDIFTFTPTAEGYYQFYFMANSTVLNVQISVGVDDPTNPPTDSGSAPSGGTFTMNGGTISNNQADYDGGGVYVEDGCTFTMNGGTISGNTASYNGGGVFVKNCNFNVSGSIVITGNTKSDNANNVYLPEGKTIKVSGALTAGANIGVTTMTAPATGKPVTFAQGSGSYPLTTSDVSRFSSDANGYYVGLNNENKAYLTVDAIITLSETDGITAAIASALPGKQAVFSRTFTENVASTVCLPFDIDATQAAAAGKFYTFVGVDKTANPWEVIMQETDPSNLVSGALTANTPYLFVPAATGPVLFYGTAPATIDAGTTSDTEGWTFKGSYTSLTYGTNLDGNVYGFAAGNYDGDGYTVSPGDFVKAMDGATIAPFRCYLTYSDGSSTRGTTGSETLPSTIAVRLVGANGNTTEMDNVHFSIFNSQSDSVYDLSGRRLNGQPSAKGIYIYKGKKVIR